jgi:uncharacterized membrane protein YkoI
MNAKTKILLATVLAGFTARAADERVDARDLPPAVQQTLEQQRAEGPVKQVTREIINGRTVYVVEIEKNNAPNPRIRIAENGTLVKEPITIVPAVDGVPVTTDEYGSVVAPVFPKINLSDLPAAVQQTARSQAAGREIVDIDRETWNGRPVYEIEFKERGLNSRVYIGDDGTVVRGERRPGQALKSLFMGTQLEDTPAAVQETVRRIAGAREIADIDRKIDGAQTVYRVEIKRGDGVQELRIAEDGKILHDSRAQPEQRRS